MKRCPACRKTYDDTQNFCLDDGTTLVSEAAGFSGSEFPTENLPYNRSSAPTEMLQGTPTTGHQGGATTPPPSNPPPSNYQAFSTPPPPPQYMPSPTRKRSPLPWIIVGVLGLVVVVVGIILATRNTGTTTGGGGPTPSPGRTSSPPTASGSTYNDPAGRFSITLPSGFKPFTVQKQSQPTPAGPIDLNFLQSETLQGACVLGYSDFPEASFEGRTPKRILEDGRDGALRNINATLEKQEDITVQGKTGIDIYGSATSGGRLVYVRFQFILDKPRAYQIGYLAYNRADLDKQDVQAYFDSFRIK
jgi:hypothetical protein